MATVRVTQRMLTQTSLGSLQANLGRMSKLQEQMSTGRIINRPSDSPTGTRAAMRLRDDVSAVQQYQLNAQDGAAWLGTIDNTLTGVSDQVRQARDTALQGANTGAVGQTALNALAATVDQLRTNLISESNTQYLGRPVFGGITGGEKAYDDSGAFVGTAGAVNRTVGDGIKVRVDADAQATFGPDGNNVFDHLDALSTALKAGDSTAIKAGITQLNADLDRLTSARAEVGTRAQQVDAATQKGADTELSLKSSLSDVENADLPKVVVDLQMQQTAYQAALAATARVMQPTLLDFLR